MRVQAYSACMDVVDSDHKPVWASLTLSLPVMKQDAQRRLVTRLFARLAGPPPATPPASLSASKVLLGQVTRCGLDPGPWILDPGPCTLIPPGLLHAAPLPAVDAAAVGAGPWPACVLLGWAGGGQTAC